MGLLHKIKIYLECRTEETSKKIVKYTKLIIHDLEKKRVSHLKKVAVVRHI